MLSEVGFEPTPSREDQNSYGPMLDKGKVYHLESGALDRSAILTYHADQWKLSQKQVPKTREKHKCIKLSK